MTDTSQNNNGNTHSSNDLLTGLLTLKGWVNELAEGRFTSSGYILSIRLTDLEHINQMYGQPGGDILLTQVVKLLQSWISEQTLLVRESRSALVYLWMPGSSHDEAQQMALLLHQSLFASGIMIASGVDIHPRVVVTIIPVSEHDVVYDVISKLERLEVREPALDAPEIRAANGSLALLNAVLEENRTFGLEPLVEKINACINLRAMKHPQTILLLSPLQSVKSRTLSIVGGFLGSSNIPMASVSCHPSDRVVRCGLMAAILLSLIPSYPPELLRIRVFPLCKANPWLASLFPTLRQDEAAPTPPDDPKLVRTTLLAVLQTMVQAYSAIIIINSLHLADTDSIAVLGALQQHDDHGLLIIGGVDTEGDGIPAVVNPLVTSATKVIVPEPFTEKTIGKYIDKVLPGVKTPALVKLLRERCGGWLLSMESLLRSWAETGVLNHDQNRWQLDAATISGEVFSALSPQERLFLVQAALVGPVQISFLTALWKLKDNDETQAIVDHARNIGFLLLEDPKNPQHVEFRDEDHAAQLIELLTQEDVLRTHAEIAILLEDSSVALQEIHTETELAYHLAESGQNEQARQHQTSLPKSLGAFIETIMAQQPEGTGVDDESSMPQHQPLEKADLPVLINAIIKIRLVGVAYRIYPANSEIVRTQMEDAIAALDEVFTVRPSLAISSDGAQIALEGRIQDRRDLATPLKDYLNWMNEAQLQTLGFLHGTTAEELTEMFLTIAEYDTVNATESLLQQLQALKLPHIRFVPRQQQINQMYKGGGNTINVPAELAGSLLMDLAGQAMIPAIRNSPYGIEPNLEQKLNPSQSPGSLDNQFATAEPTLTRVIEELGTTPAHPLAADTAAATMETGNLGAAAKRIMNLAATMNNPASMTANDWSQLPTMLDGSDTQVRRSVMDNLNRWLAKSPYIFNEPVNLSLNKLLLDRLAQERDISLLHETARAAMARLQALVKRHDWAQVLNIMESVNTCAKNETDVNIQEEVVAILDTTTQSDEFHELVNSALQDPERIEELRRLISNSGSRTWPILMSTLIHSNIMQVRMCVMQLMKEYGADALPLLITELRNPYPWYVYRNLLLAVSEVGSAEAMPAVAALFQHVDPRVRSVALQTAIRIGGEDAGPYLLKGLSDDDVEVRSQAAALAGTCPRRDIMLRLIQILKPRMLDKEEPESIQIAAALALGQFQEVEARDCLIQLLTASFLRRKSDNIRVAIINALA
ncbi:MAG: HEAT repeat domain-containing protein, partial [bacterium]